MNDHSRELCTMYTVKLSAPLKIFVFLQISQDIYDFRQNNS